SPRRVLFGSRLTLLVNVSSTATHGSKRHVSACADAANATKVPQATWRRMPNASGENFRRTRPAHAPGTSVRALVPVIAIIGPDVGPASLVEQHQHDVAIFDRRERVLDGVLRSRVGGNDHDDLTHGRSENPRCGRRQ